MPREVILPALLRGRDRYERALEGWVDNTHPDAFTHTVRLDDDERAVEVAVVALPPPSYTIREARRRGDGRGRGGRAGRGRARRGRAPGAPGDEAAARARRARGGRRPVGVLAARHHGLERPAELVLCLQRRGSRAVRHPAHHDADAARPLQPAAGPAPDLRAPEARAARAGRRPPASLPRYARQRPRLRADLRDR